MYLYVKLPCNGEILASPPSPAPGTSCWYLEIGHGGSIYTREVGKCYKSMTLQPVGCYAPATVRDLTWKGRPVLRVVVSKEEGTWGAVTSLGLWSLIDPSPSEGNSVGERIISKRQNERQHSKRRRSSNRDRTERPSNCCPFALRLRSWSHLRWRLPARPGGLTLARKRQPGHSRGTCSPKAHRTQGGRKGPKRTAGPGRQAAKAAAAAAGRQAGEHGARRRPG